MKAFIVLAIALLVRDSIATPVLAVAETGQSAQFRSEDNLGNYNFGYNEDHTSGGTFRREVGDAHGNVAGSYGLRDADGRIRIVNYIANDDGFKADIKTNEPGVEPKDTADATFNKAESVIVQSVATAPVLSVPVAAPVPVAAVAPVFPAASAVAVAKSAYAFPAPAAAVAKTHTTYSTEIKPAAYAISAPAPVVIAEPAVRTYAFPEPAAAVAKTHTTYTTETKPAAYAISAPAPLLHAPAAVVSAPVVRAYAFPEPAAAVAKSQTTYTTTETKHAIAAPAAIIAEPAVRTYAFPARAAVPVAKSATIQYAAAPAPITYAAAPAPITYAAGPAPLTYAAAPVATAPLAYAAAPVATAPLAYAAPTSKFAYTTEIHNAAPATYVAQAPYAVPGLRYHINPQLSGLQYATPFYKTVYSPAVASFAGAVPYFNNIAYKGTPFIKK